MQPHDDFPINDDYSRHPNLATCYQLTQFILKIDSALDEKVKLKRLVVQSKSPGQRWVGRISPFLYKQVWKTLVGSFQSRGVISGRRALPIEQSLICGCGQGHELAKDI